MRNIAQIGRREIEAHRKTLDGITAEQPRYVVVDLAGNKEWVVDVYIGPLDQEQPNIIRNVPIAPVAHNLVTDVRQPVQMERSKQGRYTVVGRSKVIPAGAQMPEGTILEPTYHFVTANLADLGLLFTADLDYELEGWGWKPWGATGKPWQAIAIRDAFGALLVGPDMEPDEIPAMFNLEPIRSTTTRHTRIIRKPWGSFQWGRSAWGAYLQDVVELTE